MLVSRVGSPTSRGCQARHACVHHGLRYPDSLTLHWRHYPAPLPLWRDFQNQLDLVLTCFRDWFWLYTTTFLVRFSQERGFHPFWGIVQHIILSIYMSITVSYVVNMKTAGLGFIFERTIFSHRFVGFDISNTTEAWSIWKTLVESVELEPFHLFWSFQKSDYFLSW